MHPRKTADRLPGLCRRDGRREGRRHSDIHAEAAAQHAGKSEAQDMPAHSNSTGCKQTKAIPGRSAQPSATNSLLKNHMTPGPGGTLAAWQWPPCHRAACKPSSHTRRRPSQTAGRAGTAQSGRRLGTGGCRSAAACRMSAASTNPLLQLALSGCHAYLKATCIYTPRPCSIGLFCPAVAGQHLG
jgi:hypothetical protein